MVIPVGFVALVIIAAVTALGFASDARRQQALGANLASPIPVGLDLDASDPDTNLGANPGDDAEPNPEVDAVTNAGASTNARPQTEVAAPLAFETVPHGAGLDKAQVTRNIAFGPLDEHRLDLYLPSDRTITPTPVLVHIFGSAWILGTKEGGMELAGPITNMINEGWAVAAISHRLASPTSKHPDALHDVKRAIRWIKANGPTYGLDPTTVVVSGHSSGGHLALLAGLSAGTLEPEVPPPLDRVDSRPTAVVAFAPVVDLPHFSTLDPLHPDRVFQKSVAAYFGCPITQPICDQAANHLANPLSHLDPNDPPVYLVHGEGDNVVPARQHSIAASEQLAAILGTERVWLDIVRGADHDYLGANAAALADFLTRVRERRV